MKQHNLRLFGFIALAIPFLAMTWMIGSNLQQLAHTEYRVAIQGYDPRDLLRGHYLIFQYKWPDTAQNECHENSKNCCACFTGDPKTPNITFAECQTLQEPKTCDGILKVANRWGGTHQPDEALRRYYIPEAQARALETLLRDKPEQFEIGLVPQYDAKNPKKNGKVKMLYINNQTLPQFLHDMQAAPSTASY